MGRLPRLALGTVQSLADSEPATWALLDLLNRHGLQVQHFRSQACFAPRDGFPSTITGLGSRHLDTWSMSEEVCGEVFLRAAESCDLALVEGHFSRLAVVEQQPAASQLDRLCQWLSLPSLAIVDVQQMGQCQLPLRPTGLTGVILDRVSSPADGCRWQTQFETLWGVPVLGVLDHLPRLRAAIAAVPAGTAPPIELCRQLGDSLRTDIARLCELADRHARVDYRPQLFQPQQYDLSVRVAMAYDAAFHCYFPDTLDLLELRGAQLLDFSPLRDEALPPDTDIVYFGCGHPEQYGRELADNHCMISALRNHVCSGRRIYAEGGGLAYLCQQIELTDGSQWPMAGVLPATARLNPAATAPVPYEATLASSNWLGAAGTRLRGYLNSCWQIQPHSELTRYLEDQEHEWDLVGRHHAIGSRLHFNFAAWPQVLASFLKPHAASLDWAQCRAAR